MGSGYLYHSQSKMKDVYILVDCNCFYVSCERVFQPKLNNKPVIVLSNNDGCVIALSEEAKNIGIVRGQPYFQINQLCLERDVSVFSSNYELYGDMSARIMNIIKSSAFNVEIYSIDEAFIKLSVKDDIDEFMESLQSNILKYTGVPVSVGAGHSKTLAKVANHYSKNFTHVKLFNLINNENINDVLYNTAIDKVWGIGSRYAEKFRTLGINTALQLSKCDPDNIRKRYSVVLERTVRELNGEPCLNISEVEPKKSITNSRSFSKPVESFDDLYEALYNYCAKAAYRLRSYRLKAKNIKIYIRTNKFNKNSQLRSSRLEEFEIATNCTFRIAGVVKKLLKVIYKKGIKYHKAGIILGELLPESQNQGVLFNQGELFDYEKNQDIKKASAIISTIDNINNRMGKDTVFIAAQGIERNWSMKRNMKSPNYTTDWEDLAIAY